MTNKAKIDISAICRTGLAGVPLIGGPLAQAWSEWDGKQKLKRVEAALYDLRLRIEAEPITLDPARLTAGHFQFFAETMRRLEIESRETKRQRFISLLSGFWTGAVPEYDEATDFLYAIDRLSDEHVMILRYLRDNPSYPSFKDLRHLIDPNEATPESDARIIAALNLLAGELGFVRRSWTLGGGDKAGSLLLSTKNLGPEGLARNCKHQLTGKGMQFLKSIENRTQQSGAAYVAQGAPSADP